MISEVINALFLTYCATEYLVASTLSTSSPSSRSSSSQDRLINPWTILSRRTRRLVLLTLLVLLINAFDHYWLQWTHVLSTSVHQFYHAPKIVIVIVLYLLALYLDCWRIVQTTTSMVDKQTTQTTTHHNDTTTAWNFFQKDFGPLVVKVTCRLLPIYPFLAVIISFGFLLVITIFETLHLDLSVLNGPIYYGTLYGPFSLIYKHVKQDIVARHTTTTFLPLASGKR